MCITCLAFTLSSSSMLPWELPRRKKKNVEGVRNRQLYFKETKRPLSYPHKLNSSYPASLPVGVSTHTKVGVYADWITTMMMMMTTMILRSCKIWLFLWNLVARSSAQSLVVAWIQEWLELCYSVGNLGYCNCLIVDTSIMPGWAHIFLVLFSHPPFFFLTPIYLIMENDTIPYDGQDVVNFFINFINTF